MATDDTSQKDKISFILKHLEVAQKALAQTEANAEPQAQGMTLDEDDRRKRTNTEGDTHKHVHRCIRVLLGVGTVAVSLFVIFLMYVLSFLIWKYIHFISSPSPEVAVAKEEIETLLSHIWKIVSGSSFLIILAQALLIGIKKNIKL